MGLRRHDEYRHQILKHAPAPRNERGTTGMRGKRAAEPKPMLRSRIALGDRDEACEPCLGREEIVRRWVESIRTFAKSDREQSSALVQEHSEVHAQRDRPRTFREAPETSRRNGLGLALRARRIVGELATGRRDCNQVAGKIAGIHGRYVRWLQDRQVGQSVPIVEAVSYTHLT